MKLTTKLQIEQQLKTVEELLKRFKEIYDGLWVVRFELQRALRVRKERKLKKK